MSKASDFFKAAILNFVIKTSANSYIQNVNLLQFDTKDLSTSIN